MQSISKRLFVAIVASLGVTGLALAQNYDITWSTIDGGGGTSTGGAFTLSGSIGQPDAGPPMTSSGGTFELTGGFWVVSQVCHCPGDMNGDGQKDGRDIGQFIDCMLVGGSCSCAELDGSAGLSPADVDALVTQMLAAQPCP